MAEQPKKEGALKELGGFELIEKIGQGGMGSVFKARQISLDRIVALKVLPPSVAKDARFIERFQREARACAKLNHPNIVQGVDVGKDAASGVWYFAMELVDGPSALKLLKSQRVLPEERALEIAQDIARALECAASHGIVHRDIKPDNILLTALGEAKLADLGLAKQVNDDATLTQSGQAVGTPYYMAPEQIRGRAGEIDIRTDIYALGGTLFHLVTGQAPFTGETSAVIMSKHLTTAAPKAHSVNPAVSEACSKLIEQMMQKERERRVQSPAELLQRIERILHGEKTTKSFGNAVTGRRKKEIVQTPPNRTPLILAGVGALVLLVVVVIVVVSGSSVRPESKPAADAREKPAQVAATPAAKEPASSVSHITETAKPATPSPNPPQPEAPVVAETKKQPAPEIAGSPFRPTTPKAASETAPAVSFPASVAKAPPSSTDTGAPASAGTPSPAPSAAREPWPIVDMLAALRESAPKKAVERIGAGNYAAKETLLGALNLLDSQRESRLAAIAKLIGQPVKLETAKGAQNGKLIAVKNGVMQLEREIVIDGESRGSTQVTVAIDELTPAALERIAPLPAPAAPAEWLAAALTALTAGQLDAAGAALKNIADAELREPLAAHIKQTRISEREAQARAAWAKIEAHAAEAPSQARARQWVDELAAFSKKFAESDFAATPEIAVKMLALKESFERLSLGLDPRVLKLFKGRVVNYDARTQVITLNYDLQTKEQTEDFIGSEWAPPGDQTGLTWKKGELRTFCKSTADRIFQMPQFVSGTLNIQLDCKKIDTSKRNRFEVEISFHGLKSDGKTPKTSFRANEKGCAFLNAGIGGNGATELKSSDEVLFRTDGTLELSCQGAQLSAKMNGKTVLEYTLPKPNDHSGFWIGGGWDSGITFTKLQISGRLDPAWLVKALESAAAKTR